jgi:ADP-ribosylglycohydrolase
MDTEARLHDRVCGLLIGAALGDAIGLSTEYLPRAEAEAFCARGPLCFQGWPRLSPRGTPTHCANWEEGDWTDDTDMQLCILDSLLAAPASREVSARDVASRFAAWAQGGFPEAPFFDSRAVGIGGTTNAVLNSPLIRGARPEQAALYCWASPALAELGQGSPCANASNGALMRTAVLGARAWWDAAATERGTAAVARLTHPDPRAVGACVAMTALVAALLRRAAAGGAGRGPARAELERALAAGDAAVRRAVEELPGAVEAMVAAVRALPDHPRFPEHSINRTGDAVAAAWAQRRGAVAALADSAPTELRAHALAPSLDSLELDEGGVSYVLKTLGAGCWALRALRAAEGGAAAAAADGAGGGAGGWAAAAEAAGEAELGPELAAMAERYAPTSGGDWFKACTAELVRRGADADTNCTVAGALMGAHLGLAALPPDWVAGLRHGAWLRARAERFADLVVRDWRAVQREAAAAAAAAPAAVPAPARPSFFAACCASSRGGVIARVPTQFAEPAASRQCSYFALGAAAAARELLALALAATGAADGGGGGGAAAVAAFVAAYAAVLSRASAAKRASPDEPFIETVYSPRPLRAARAFLREPLRARYAGGPAAHAAAATADGEAALELDEFVHTVANARAPNLYDEPDIWGGAGTARMADYAADKAAKLATREVPWAGMRGALAALLEAPAAGGGGGSGAVRVAVVHRLVMAFAVVAAPGEAAFLVLDSHAAEAGWMDAAALERYIAYDAGNAPGGGSYMVVTWATGRARGQ